MKVIHLFTKLKKIVVLIATPPPTKIYKFISIITAPYSNPHRPPNTRPETSRWSVFITQKTYCKSQFLSYSRETNQPRYRLNLYRQAQNLLNQEMPVIPLAHGIQYQANHNSLSGFQMSPFNVRSFHTVERSE